MEDRAKTKATHGHAVVVGGGVMGCSSALRLAQRGFKVTVIERGVPGAEASSAAAGILGPQWESDEGGPMLDLCLESRSMFPAFAEELRGLSGIDIGFRNSGLLEVPLSEADWSGVRHRCQWQRAAGLRTEVVEGKAVQELEPNLDPSIPFVVRMEDEGVTNARMLARALSQAAAVAGVEFMQGRYVKSVNTAGGGSPGSA